MSTVKLILDGKTVTLIKVALRMRISLFEGGADYASQEMAREYERAYLAFDAATLSAEVVLEPAPAGPDLERQRRLL